MAAADEDSKVKEEVKGGELLFCGTTAWEAMGRRRTTPEENLVSPTRLRPLMGVDIRFVASGCGKPIYLCIFFLWLVEFHGSEILEFAFVEFELVWKFDV